nr:hypothetical protein BaRGS_003550 [Batillaria attramentaria]
MNSGAVYEASVISFFLSFAIYTVRPDTRGSILLTLTMTSLRNLTLRNWAQLKPLIVPVVFTNSSRVASRAEENGWHVLPISQTAVGVPILKYMYLDVMAR